MTDLKMDIGREEVAIAMGGFDGVHLGHQDIINQMVRESKNRGLMSAVYTFNNVPKSISKAENSIQILRAKDKYEILKSMGVDIVYMHNFDDTFMKTTRESFLENLLDYFDIKLIVVGKDFKFGHKAKGNVDWLMKNKEKYGFDLIASDFYEMDGEKVSSTAIRNYIKSGDMRAASKLLGRRHFVKGNVIDGRKMGRKLGFPTANVQVYKEMSIISNGVYYTKTILGSKSYDSITNVGNVPSFTGAAFSVESYLLNFEADIYGEEIKVEFVEKLRDEVKFDKAEDLSEQISKDIERVKVLIAEEN